jgi:predicted house-cleaning noncanonical NTP pyrophosphatase (MazG superfamily)
VLGETEFLAALRNKLDEEVAEFQATTSGDGRTSLNSLTS